MKDTLLFERIPLLRSTRAYEYAPGIQYDGGKYLAQGITSFGQSIGTGIDDLIKKHDKIVKEREEMAGVDEYNDLIVSHAYDKNLGPFSDPDPVKREEALNKYHAMSHTQKTGFAAGLGANIVSDWQQQRMEMAAHEGQPQLLTLPDGSTIPGHYYIPGARSVIDTTKKAQQRQPMIGEEVTPGFIWNGHELVEKRAVKQDEGTLLLNAQRQRKLAALNQELGTAQGEIATGNVRPGPDWLPLTTTYADQVKKLLAQRAALQQPQSGNDLAAPPGPSSGNGSSQKIRVRAPNGQVGLIPPDQLEAALAQGYQQIQ